MSTTTLSRKFFYQENTSDYLFHNLIVFLSRGKSYLSSRRFHEGK